MMLSFHARVEQKVGCAAATFLGVEQLNKGYHFKRAGKGYVAKKY